MTVHLAIVLLLLLGTPAAGYTSDYRFTFTNPSIGSWMAPWVLEYYSLPDCGACSEFERNGLSELMAFVERGQLRIVFRDLSPAVGQIEQAIRLFCLQVLPSYHHMADLEQAKRWYLDRRVGAKREGDVVLEALHGEAAAQLADCLSGDAALDVMAHNREAFDVLGMRGTPGFALSELRSPATPMRLWSGPAAASELLEVLKQQWERDDG